MTSKSLAFAALTFTLAPLQADFSYQETTKITGGSLTKMMKFIPGGGKMFEPKTSSVYLKGDRLVHVMPETMSIIDLASETMIEVNLEKKTYASITFAEMREAMEKMAARMQEAMAKSKKSGEPAPQFDMKMSIKGTGQTRSIGGIDTRQYIMLIDMNLKAESGAAPVGMSEIETDMWMAKKIPGYDEVQAFYVRMSKKMGYSPNMNPLLMQQAGSAEGLKKAAEEMAKLDGTPVLTITRMKGTSAMAGLRGSPSSANQDNNDRPKMGGGLAGLAATGIMGGLRRKNKDAPKAEETAGATPAPGDNVMMETQSEHSNFSSVGIPAAKLDIPAGFQKIEHPMKKALDRK